MALRLERFDDTQSLYYKGVPLKTTCFAESVRKAANVTSVTQRSSASRFSFIHQVLLRNLERKIEISLLNVKLWHLKSIDVGIC